ncbi:MAG: GNAT family N-acetyltransferase [Anaerolineae bacterium]|nr:GNAT family N-acetyltransferase [Anaerolineae bacterium]
MPDLTLSLTNTPEDSDVQQVQAGLAAYNGQHAEPDGYEPLCIFLRDPAGKLVGGLLGNTYWGWLNISILWLRDDVRQGGYGKRMVQLAEAEAVRRGCQAAHVDTLDFQAPDFYRKLGYTVWGQLDDLPPGHTRYFLKKTLPGPDASPAHGVD